MTRIWTIPARVGEAHPTTDDDLAEIIAEAVADVADGPDMTAWHWRQIAARVRAALAEAPPADEEAGPL